MLREPFYGRAPPGVFGANIALSVFIKPFRIYMRQRSAAAYYTYYIMYIRTRGVSINAAAGKGKLKRNIARRTFFTTLIHFGSVD
jgi:hypothetical protein